MQLAKQAGLRNRNWNGATWLRLLVFGWLAHPQAGISQLVRVANSMEIKTSKQALAAHFTPKGASFLLAILQQAVRKLVEGPQVAIPLLARFTALYIEDGSTVSLPAALSSIWRGNGGNPEGKQGPLFQGMPKVGKEPKTEAALKITLRWDLLRGALCGPYLQAGRQPELASVLREEKMKRGSLWIGDLGYFALIWLAQLSREGIWFLIRYKDGIIVWVAGRRLDDILSILPAHEGEQVELPVELGGSKQVAARLLASRVPEEVAAQRRARVREAARKKQKPPSAHTLALCSWTIVLTTVPACLLSQREAQALLRARWQIELLFKLWKDQALVDEWSSSNPWQILCEIYAKLIAMIVQHWFLILGCWDDPHHSLFEAAGVMRERSAVLLAALCGHCSLPRAVHTTISGIRQSCPLPSRSDRPSTSHLLLGHPFWGLT